MRVDKISISFDIRLGDDVRHAAEKAGKPLSTWLAEAAATKLRAEALAEFLADWEAEHGAFTEEELAEASRKLGLPTRKPVIKRLSEASGERADPGRGRARRRRP